MRAAAGLRDATIISVLAYAGLRPGELRELRWRQVRERTLLIDAAKTGCRRTVRLLLALEDSPQLPAEEAIRRAREDRDHAALYPFCTSEPGRGDSAGRVPAAVECPEQDSNLRPTP